MLCIFFLFIATAHMFNSYLKRIHEAIWMALKLILLELFVFDWFNIEIGFCVLVTNVEWLRLGCKGNVCALNCIRKVLLICECFHQNKTFQLQTRTSYYYYYYYYYYSKLLITTRSLNYFNNIHRICLV